MRRFAYSDVSRIWIETVLPTPPSSLLPVGGPTAVYDGRRRGGTRNRFERLMEAKADAIDTLKKGPDTLKSFWQDINRNIDKKSFEEMMVSQKDFFRTENDDDGGDGGDDDDGKNVKLVFLKPCKKTPTPDPMSLPSTDDFVHRISSLGDGGSRFNQEASFLPGLKSFFYTTVNETEYSANFYTKRMPVLPAADTETGVRVRTRFYYDAFESEPVRLMYDTNSHFVSSLGATDFFERPCLPEDVGDGKYLLKNLFCPTIVRVDTLNEGTVLERVTVKMRFVREKFNCFGLEVTASGSLETELTGLQNWKKSVVDRAVATKVRRITYWSILLPVQDEDGRLYTFSVAFRQYCDAKGVPVNGENNGGECNIECENRDVDCKNYIQYTIALATIYRYQIETRTPSGRGRLSPLLDQSEFDDFIGSEYSCALTRNQIYALSRMKVVPSPRPEEEDSDTNDFAVPHGMKVVARSAGIGALLDNIKKNAENSTDDPFLEFDVDGWYDNESDSPVADTMTRSFCVDYNENSARFTRRATEYPDDSMSVKLCSFSTLDDESRWEEGKK